jgi:histidine kinase
METLMGRDPLIAEEERKSFVDAVNEVLWIAAAASLASAVVVSVFVTRRIVNPVRAMTEASRNIAAGDYHKRVQMPEPDELGSLANSFNQMAQQLEQTEFKRVELIGDVAHELRTPLASIRSTMEGLVDGVVPTEPATFIGVQREVTRLQRLVQDLEELSRAEAGQIVLDLHPLDVSTLIQSAAERLRPQYAGKDVTLRLDVPSSLPQVRADVGRMTQVLINLLGNALQYTPAQGQVTVRAWHDGGNVQVAVQDTGIGITPEHLPHIFERFYRVDKSRSRIGGGSGIGLTIARHLIEAHGGRIWVMSNGVEQGSRFTFTLPALS